MMPIRRRRATSTRAVGEEASAAAAASDAACHADGFGEAIGRRLDRARPVIVGEGGLDVLLLDRRELVERDRAFRVS